MHYKLRVFYVMNARQQSCINTKLRAGNTEFHSCMKAHNDSVGLLIQWIGFPGYSSLFKVHMYMYHTLLLQRSIS